MHPVHIPATQGAFEGSWLATTVMRCKVQEVDGSRRRPAGRLFGAEISSDKRSHWFDARSPGGTVGGDINLVSKV